MRSSDQIRPFSQLNRRHFLGGIGAAAFVVPRQALAQAYPSRPIKMIVPFTPAGSTDAAGRILAREMEVTLGQNIVVENKPGAGGNIGIDAVAKSPPDGYTIGVSGTGSTILGHLMGPQPNYKVEDLAYIGHISLVEFALLVRKDFPANTVQELIAVAKANPGKFRYAEGGGPTRLAFELFGMMTGANLVRVPYKGDAPVLNDLLGGHVDATFQSMAGSLSQIQAGQVKALAVASPTRSKALPEVPTVAEAGVPGYTAGAATMMVVAKATPEPIVRKINDALNMALRKPEVLEKYAAMGLSAIPQTPAEAAETVRRDMEKWAKVIKDANIPVEK